MQELVDWWRGIGRGRRLLAGGAVSGVMALVVQSEITHDPWPFVLAALLTLPYGLTAYLGIYPAFAVARLLVTGLTGATGDTNDRWTQAVSTPINMVTFAIAALATLRMLDALLARWTGARC